MIISKIVLFSVFFALSSLSKSSAGFRPACYNGIDRPTLIGRLFAQKAPSEVEGKQPEIAVPTKTRPLVQRKYQTYTWKHSNNNYNINYRVEGSENAPPLLFVHGFGANVNHFRYNIPAMVNAGYRVYAIDLLGFGASDKPKEEDYCIELFSKLIQDFIQDMNNRDPWIICGNSIGGLCCLSVADALPHRIQAIVLFNCSGGMSGFRYEDVPSYLRVVLWFVQKVLLGPFWGGRFFSRFKSRENVESILRYQGVYRNTTNVDDELLEVLLGPSDDEGAEQVFLQVFGGPPGPTPESLLPNIACPILALWGGQDPWTPVDAGMHPGTRFSDYTKDFTLQILPGVGHCPHDEAPDECHQRMIPWLQEARSRYRPTI